MSLSTRSGQNPEPHSSSSAVQEKSSISSSLNLSFLKLLAEKRLTDGKSPKKRGPKPDSRPALTRRQELNRQAQRSHRERKEIYIKALEEEVLRLKELYSNISQDRTKLADENMHLKHVLAQHGIAPSGQGPIVDYAPSSCISSGSHGYESRSTFTPSLTSRSNLPANSSPKEPYSPSGHALVGHQLQLLARHHRTNNSGMDYDQTGIDFVLTLEKPCMNHMPWLLERAAETGNEPCGHALMASCPPEPFPELTSNIPFGYTHIKGELTSGQRTWELSKADLTTLLDLSMKIDLDGEITPVMAWGMIMGHPRFFELQSHDFLRLVDELKSKVRCYGFGAVMEEFEVRDALENVISKNLD